MSVQPSKQGRLAHSSGPHTVLSISKDGDSGELAPALNHFLSKTIFFPCTQPEFLLFQLVTVAFCPVAEHL